MSAWESSPPTFSIVSPPLFPSPSCPFLRSLKKTPPARIKEPVTSVTLTSDSAMLLVSTLDSTLRLMDLEKGQCFQTFQGHKNVNYRSKACFGVGEGSVWMGDDEGAVRGWDVESVRVAVSFYMHSSCVRMWY